MHAAAMQRLNLLHVMTMTQRDIQEEQMQQQQVQQQQNDFRSQLEASLDSFLQANCPSNQQLEASLNAFIAANVPPMTEREAIKAWEHQQNMQRNVRVQANNATNAAIVGAGASIKVATGDWVYKHRAD